MPVPVFRFWGFASTHARAFRHSARTSSPGNNAVNSETRVSGKCHVRSPDAPVIGNTRKGGGDGGGAVASSASSAHASTVHVLETVLETETETAGLGSHLGSPKDIPRS